MLSYPTPHGDKLRAILKNAKLPAGDRPRVSEAIKRYEDWIGELEDIGGNYNGSAEPLVDSLRRYKLTIDLDLVFDSRHDFLYRQKGQLKLDNTVLEEFLPRLVGGVFGDRLADLHLVLGPANAFSQLHFDSSLADAPAGGGIAVRSKDHDFALARPLYLKASHDQDFAESHEASTHLAYVAAEIKTNLDKTMFQEASATAYDLRLALPHSRYFLLCEWLDMTPISTAVTAIEEVIVLRKAKRLSANVRRHFSTRRGRTANRDLMVRYLTENPFATESFDRFLGHVRRLLGVQTESQQQTLDRGWF